MIWMRSSLDRLRSILLIIALKRSSWARRAWRTSQTTWYFLLSLSASSGVSPDGMPTGRMM